MLHSFRLIRRINKVEGALYSARTPVIADDKVDLWAELECDIPTMFSIEQTTGSVDILVAHKVVDFNRADDARLSSLKDGSVSVNF